MNLKAGWVKHQKKKTVCYETDSQGVGGNGMSISKKENLTKK